MDFKTVLPLLSVAVIFLARMLELGARRKTVPGPVREQITFRLFLLAGSLMLFGGAAEFLWKELALSWPTFIAGWMCGIASFVIRRRAITELGRFWSLHIEIRDNHEFVRSGPFRWMRHPTYFSMILELLSGALILNAPFAFLAAILVFVPTLLWRLRWEEAAMIQKFGDAYRTYQQTTPAIIPYRWPRTS